MPTKQTKRTTAKETAAKIQTVKKAAAKRNAPEKPLPKKSNGKPHISEEILEKGLLSREGRKEAPQKLAELEKSLLANQIKPTVPVKKLLNAINSVNPRSSMPIEKMPEDIRKSIETMKSGAKRFHGIKVNLGYFPFPWVKSPCADKFGYLTPASVRTASALPFNITNQILLGQLGDLMGNSGRDTGPDSIIPSGYTYFGQFVDHDITLDVSSTLDAPVDANTINNMRSPVLDLVAYMVRVRHLIPICMYFQPQDLQRL